METACMFSNCLHALRLGFIRGLRGPTWTYNMTQSHIEWWRLQNLKSWDTDIASLPKRVVVHCSVFPGLRSTTSCGRRDLLLPAWQRCHRFKMTQLRKMSIGNRSGVKPMLIATIHSLLEYLPMHANDIFFHGVLRYTPKYPAKENMVWDHRSWADLNKP